MKKFLPFNVLLLALIFVLFGLKSSAQAFVYQSGDYRPISAGVSFASDGLWESYNGSVWTTVATAPQNLPVASKPPRIIINKSSIDGAANSANTYNNIIIVSGGALTLSDNTTPSANFISSNNYIEVQNGGVLTVNGQISINSNAGFIVRSGGSATLNNGSIDNSHPIWAGTENFESGSVFNINNWNWLAGATKLNIINSSSSVSNNVTGYKFGILSLNVTPSIPAWSLSGGTASFCDTLNITNNSANAIILTSDVNSPAITVRTINHNSGAFYLSASLSGAATQTINILNNLTSTAGSLKLFYTGGGTASNVNVNLSGNLTVASASSGFTNDGGSPNIGLNFTGTAIQTIDAAVTVTAVPMTVINGAYVQLKNQDVTVTSTTGTTAVFTVQTGGTLDFGFAPNGTTALNIKKVATGGTNQFTTQSGSTLKITSPLGLQTSGTGNVQFSSASNITVNQAATFWYIGRADQVTGNLLTTGGAARTVYVNLLDNTKTLTLSNSIGISAGNRLEIQKGIVQGTSTGDFTGAGYLVMTDGNYMISTPTVTVPQLSGYSSYSLTGGTVTLNGNNVNQILSGVPPTYYNLTFTGTNTAGNSKGISSATNVTNNVTISSSAIVDVSNKTLGGTGTASFTMTGTSRYITAGTLVKPDVGGTYSLGTGTTIEFSNTTAGTTEDIRLAPNYYNIDISGSNVGISTTTGSVSLAAGGTFTVKTGGTFKVMSTAGFSGLATTAISSSSNPTIALQTGSTIEYNGANQNISARTDYQNVTTSGSGVKTLTGDITVNSILKFTAGIIATGANKVIIPSAGSITGGGTGWVNGNLQKNFSTGSNQSQLFEVGDAVYYSPVTITLPTVTTAGGLVVSATAAALTPQATVLNSNRVIKRYWTIGSAAASGTLVSYTGNYSAAVNWNSADNSAFSPVLILSNLKSALYTGTSWSYPTISSSPVATVTSATITGIAAKGNLILAEACASASNVKITYTPAAWCISAPASAATTPVIADSSGVSGTFNIPTGLTINQTTGQITPNTSTANTYTVQYAIPSAGGCSLYNATTIVTINSLPKLFTVTPAQSSYCTSGSGVKVGLSGSETSVTYQLLLNGTNTGSPVSGTNAAISFGNQTAAGTYTVTAANSTTGCTNNMTGSAVITINTNNTAKITVQPQPAVVCTGNATFTVTATGTASPAYQWQVSLDTGKTYTNIVNGSLYSGTQTSTLSITSPSTVSNPILNLALYRAVAGTSFCYPDTSTGALLYTSSENPWVGQYSSDGLNGVNWCNGHNPNSDRDIIVPVVNTAAGFYYPILTSKKTYRLIKNLYIAPTAVITIGLNRLTIRGNITGTGKIIGDTLASALQFDSTCSGTLYFDQGKDSVSNAVQSFVMNTSGTITVATKLYIIDSLTSISGILNTSDSITLRSTTIDSTAQVTAVTGTINGKVTVERFITAKRTFRFLSPSVTTTGSINANWMEGVSNSNPNNPVNPHPGYGTEITGNKGSVNGFDQTPTNNPSLYTYNKALNRWDSLLTTSGTLTAGNPLRLLIRGDRSLRLTTNTPTPTKTILREFGTLFIGTKALNLSNTPALNGAANGFSFIGNPYASPVRWDSVYKSSSNITASYYAYDPNINQKGAYVSYNSILGYNSTFGVSAVDNNIQSGQGVLIQNTAGTIPSLQFKETYKSSKNTKTFKTMSNIPALAIQLLRLNTSDSSYQLADGSIAAYDNQFSDSIGAEDSYKFNNQDENISILRNRNYLSIEGRPTITANDTISLQMWQFRQNSYNLKLNPVNFAAGVTAVIKDAYLNTTTPVSLSAITMVPFSITTASASYAIDRFTIIFNNNSTLPVTITNVKAYRKGEGIQVDWVAQTETNIDRYEVEASPDGRTFEKAATIKAKGNNTVIQNYGWYDENSSAGNHFYRIKVIEKSGAVKYSEIVKVNITGGNSSISVYPNPVKGKTIAVHLINMEKGKYNVTLYNDLGQKVYAGAIDHAGGSVTYNIVIGNKLSQESYKLTISNGDSITTETIVFE